MNNESFNNESINNKQPETDWHTLTGELSFRVNNDYLFRALLQFDNYVLKELIASLLHWDPDDIVSAQIQNPIELGAFLEAKYYVLDVKVLLNDRIMMNLEMQILNEGDWPDRSLCYLCRIFDRLNRGDVYTDVKPAYHIGFTDFSPLPDHTEFYSTYQLLNVRSHQKFTDKFTLSVVDLSHIEDATETDREFKLDQWAGMFKARTWEELRMLAQENQAIDHAVSTIHFLTEEDRIREQMEAREEYYRRERTKEYKRQKLEEQLSEAQVQLSEAQVQLSKTQVQLVKVNKRADEANERADAEANRADAEAERADAETNRANALELSLKEKEAEIARLKAMLESKT